MRSDPSREWFRDWFGEEYLALYPHRDEAEAAEAVQLYTSVVPPAEPTVLDLACGAGRHLAQLRRAGLQAVGLDLSEVLLRQAREADRSQPLVRADMRRLPFATSVFGGLTSFFTSFGYFASVEEDRSVVGQIRLALRDGGSFMLDFFNAYRVRETLVPTDVRQVGGRTVTQTREIVEDLVVKRIEIHGRDRGGEPQRFEERVRLYDASLLQSLLAEQGLVTTHRFGNYLGEEFTLNSERLILAGHAE